MEPSRSLECNCVGWKKMGDHPVLFLHFDVTDSWNGAVGGHGSEGGSRNVPLPGFSSTLPAVGLPARIARLRQGFQFQSGTEELAMESRFV